MAMDFPSNPTNGQASNGYTWSAAKGAWVGGPGTRYTQAEADAKFVDVTGDTMTGHLFLPTGPAAANAIRKDYADSALTLKADKTYVDTQDATKASTTYVNSQDALRVAKAGDTMTGALKTSSEFQSTNTYGFRQVVGNYGAVWYNDGGQLYLMFTNSGDQYGGYNTLRPFYVNLATGAVTLGTVNMAARPTWAGCTPWDNGNLNPAAYLPLTGGTLTGTLTISGTAGYITFSDTNWGVRHLHCNDGIIGFLSHAGGWTHQFDNNGGATFNSTLIVGGATIGTDGNIFMTWANDWLSNVLGGKCPAGSSPGGFVINGQCTVTAAGYLVTTLGGSDVQTSTASVTMTSGGTIRRTTSSQDYKTQIEDIEPEYADKVLSLRTVFYRPVTSEPDDWSRFGFIAEDAYAVDFRFANCEPEAPTTPIIHDINGIVASLLDVVRRQEARIVALEAGP